MICGHFGILKGKIKHNDFTFVSVILPKGKKHSQPINKRKGCVSKSEMYNLVPQYIQSHDVHEQSGLYHLL